MNGTKHVAEAVGSRTTAVGERCLRSEAVRTTSRGAQASEYAGM